jgi:hypothetical protein
LIPCYGHGRNSGSAGEISSVLRQGWSYLWKIRKTLKAKQRNLAIDVAKWGANERLVQVVYWRTNLSAV